jgi:hypothetical protein
MLLFMPGTVRDWNVAYGEAALHSGPFMSSAARLNFLHPDSWQAFQGKNRTNCFIGESLMHETARHVANCEMVWVMANRLAQEIPDFFAIKGLKAR